MPAEEPTRAPTPDRAPTPTPTASASTSTGVPPDHPETHSNTTLIPPAAKLLLTATNDIWLNFPTSSPKPPILQSALIAHWPIVPLWRCGHRFSESRSLF